jgi:hypothetical protein
MEMPDGKQRQPRADLSEAALWYLRSKAKHLPTEEIQEFASWLRRSPENASALLSIATRDHQRHFRRRATITFKQALMHVLRMDRANSHAHTQHRTLSYRYFDHVKRKYFLPKLALLAVCACGVAGWIFLQDVRLLKIAIVAFVGFLLLMIREAVIGFRVVSGYFGSTESEVRDFVKFITAHGGEIDFTDQGGERQPSLVQEPPSDSKASTASAPTGALSE